MEVSSIVHISEQIFDFRASNARNQKNIQNNNKALGSKQGKKLFFNKV